MSDTLLILHVKGTESETTTLPRHAVQAALSQGQITNSQLIWSTKDNAWKQVRDMPDFIPVEHLILHVKGTESETRELPKPAVRTAISQGQITQTQLIWSPVDNTWRQAREFPDLLPSEHLILHVKGTEAETRELPKPAVRAAISQGQISQTQLIWSPVDNSWKQAREFPDLLPSEHLILHVKGTEAETKELPKRAIRSAISKGEITHSQLIWSSTENSWKQVRELPDLLPSQKLAPAPVRAPVVAQPRGGEAIIPESPAGPVARAAVAAGAATPRVRVAGSGTVPRVRVAVQGPPKVRVMAQARIAAESASAPEEQAATASAQAPQVRVATASAVPQAQVAATATPVLRVAAAVQAAPMVRAVAPVQVRTTGGLEVKEAHDFHALKWVCIVMGAIIFLAVAGNYFLVGLPMTSNMGQTAYANIPVYAHFGAFMQPNVIVIHIPKSTKITPDNLTGFLVALARSTPDSPFTREPYTRVALTSGWTAQYSFAGFSWKELGDSAHESTAQLKEDFMERLSDGGGQSLLPESTLSDQAQQARRDQVWAAFVANFTARQ